jgi:presenilin-like A22 family membrane protease
MLEKKVVAFFLCFFILVQLFGLYLGNGLIALINSGEVAPAFENPNSVTNSLFLFVYIIVATAVLLVAIRYIKSIIRIIEAIVVFTASYFTFFILFPQSFILDVAAAIAFSLWRIFRPGVLIQNLTIALTIPAIGALLGTSLGILPSLIFIVLLAAYDFVSVFITKHMIYLAKEVMSRPSAFALSLPYKFKKPVVIQRGNEKIRKKFHVFQLGSGDLAIPLMFAVSVMTSYGIVRALVTVIGSCISFFFMFYFFTKKPRALPAIPIICAGTMAGFIISMMFF